MAEEIKVEAKKETIKRKLLYLVKFLISFALFCAIYDWLILPDSAGVGIGVLLVGPVSIFHFAILYYSFYCLYRLLGAISTIVFAALVFAILFSPSYIAEKHFEHLCAMAEPEAKLFPKIKDGDFVKYLGKANYEEERKENVRLKKYIKEKFGIEAVFIELLKDGRLLIQRYERPSSCSYANCWLWYDSLTNQERIKIVATKKNTALDY